MSVVGRNIPHDSAAAHASGQSVFIDDMPILPGELLVDFVGSPVAHGEVVSVDVSEAQRVPGVVAIFTHEDVPGHTAIGPVARDEHVLVEKVAEFVGDPIVLIAAETREALSRAKKAVRIKVRELPPLFGIDEAITADSFL